MRDPELFFVEAPELTPEVACHILDFMYEFINAFENRYKEQLRQPTPLPECLNYDLFADFNDDIP